MTTTRAYPLLLVTVVGVAARLFLAFHWVGSGDLLTFAVVAARAEDDPLHTYGVNVESDSLPYPYPPGYLPWLVLAKKAAATTGLPFHDLVHIAPIVADVLLASATYVYLGWRGADERQRFMGFTLVLLGPVFIAISGYHGQLDAVAILPAVLALMVWERRPGPTGAVGAGVLIGVGAVLKTVPILIVVPLVVAARRVRDGALVIAGAAATIGAACLPFVLAEPDGVRKVIGWSGPPGRGGLSLIADPSFASDRRLSPTLALGGRPGGFAEWLSDAGGVIAFVVLLAAVAFLIRYRPAPVDGIVVLWLAIFVSSPNFLLHYMIWALPFFIMAGYLRATAVLQVAVIPVLVITYLSVDAMTRPLADAYVAMMVGLWLSWVAALLTVVRRIVRRGVGPGPRPSAPLILGPAGTGHPGDRAGNGFPR